MQTCIRGGVFTLPLYFSKNKRIAKFARISRHGDFSTYRILADLTKIPEIPQQNDIRTTVFRFLFRYGLELFSYHQIF